jgi:2'-5' RNA ligase
MARIFIGIDLPRIGRATLARVQTQLQGEEAPRGSVAWVAPETFHVTLRFLGEVEEEQVEQVAAGCRRVAAETPPFQLSLGRIELLPSRQEARVVVVQVGGEWRALRQLQQKIEDVARGAGLLAERRRFHPHITLGRVRQAGGRGGLLPLWEEVTLPHLDFMVDEIHLKESELHQRGARHTCRATFPFEGGGQKSSS